MSGAMREKDQADYDLERITQMFDDALISKDERVVNALRSLLMVVALTAPETGDSAITNRHHGPFRRMQDDINSLSHRVKTLSDDVHRLSQQRGAKSGPLWPDSSTSSGSIWLASGSATYNSNTTSQGSWLGSPSTTDPYTGTK